MCSSLHDTFRSGSRFRQMLLDLDTLSRPQFGDFRNQHSWWVGRGVDPIVMVVKDDWDVQFVAHGVQVVDVVTDLTSGTGTGTLQWTYLIVFKHETSLDLVRQPFVVLLESGESCRLVAIDTAHVDADISCVSRVKI